MHRSGNITYTDHDGNVLRLVTDDDVLTLALNDEQVFTLRSDTPDGEHAAADIGTDLERWSRQARRTRWNQPRTD